VAVSAGGNSSLALTSEGTVIGWGWNHCGQTDCPEGYDFVAIAPGSLHSLALTRDGRIIGWGYNEYGQTDCPSGNNFIAVSTGGRHSLGLTRDGNIVGWGLNIDGQIDCPAGKFVSIDSFAAHSIGLRDDGTIIGWGNITKLVEGDYDPKIYDLTCQVKFALPYDFLTRLNAGLNALSYMPKYIKMEILEDYTDWEFWHLYNL
jgi:alpha-tubulin suppressor-like RCC1 family protein